MSPNDNQAFFAHPSAIIDDGAVIGDGAHVWHFAHVCPRAVIGRGCVLGQNTLVAQGVRIGDNVKIQNNVAVYEGVELEDDVFLGPSCVLTNVSNPRSQVSRKAMFEKTLIRRGATIGANATVICGVTIGRYAMVAAGAVVTDDIPDYALIIGVPGRQRGWVSRHGHPMRLENPGAVVRCPETDLRYTLEHHARFHCLDIEEDAPLPVPLATGMVPYRQLNSRKSDRAGNS
ncbi:MAG: N-acetyltransferase [Gammaproteobacteria bacterium]|nr:N-acetyltransferase [Gammaproteobacteria bacterium]NIN37252.1 N-acetyltransferase [Gammaproteobacteria bacterium]NIO26110.1 N-acetyltransferase [Gammaproteobacteria bacterium]NIO66723.1 N-acetyltransferase [Gammaproteobacteria bacterium]NIP65876.1 N-acetyltransferase [Gammaproteobacteria bacterium]